jgi:hypothetical protein
MALQDNPDYQGGLRIAAASNAMAGRPEQAHKAMARLRQLNPSGAPRSMKMGTIGSPCPYDAAARHSHQSPNLRRPAIWRYASWMAVFSISQGGPVTLR